MRVNHRVHVGALTIDFEMHRQFRRGIAITGEFAPLVIDKDHHVRRHEALGDAFRGRHQALIVKTRADVAVIAGDKPTRVQTSADFDNLGTDLFFDSATHAPCLRASVPRDRYSSRHLSEQK